MLYVKRLPQNSSNESIPQYKEVQSLICFIIFARSTTYYNEYTV